MSRTEKQKDGFEFENWVSNTFFDGYRGEYTQKWDIPAEFNRSQKLPKNHRSLNVSIKLARHRSTIRLGNAVRQRSIDTDFLVITGFWDYTEQMKKAFVAMDAVRVDKENWEELWGDITLEELQGVDKYVRSQKIPYEQARADLREWKKGKSCQININLDITSYRQRRLYCSLSSKVFWNLAKREPELLEKPVLFDEIFR